MGDGAGGCEGLQPPEVIAGEERVEVADTVSQRVVQHQGEQGGGLLSWSQEADRGGLQECYLGRKDEI